MYAIGLPPAGPMPASLTTTLPLQECFLFCPGYPPVLRAKLHVVGNSSLEGFVGVDTDRKAQV